MAVSSFTPHYCGFCHSPRVSGCRRPVHPDARCEASGPAHHAYATRITTWVETSTHGDVGRLVLLLCDHPACEGRADTFAHLTGHDVETRPLTADDVAEHLGLAAAVSA